MEDVGSGPGGPVRPPGVVTPAFLTLLGASFVAISSFQLLTASLPLYAVRLGADDAVLGLMGGVIAVMSLVARPWVGWWLDAGGTVLALQAGILMFALAAMGYWLTASVGMILVFRGLTGVGIALFSTAGQTLTTALSPPERRGEALSLYALALPVAQILAPPAGVAVARRFTDGTLFAVCIATGLVAIGLASRLWRHPGVPVHRGPGAVGGRRPILFNRRVWLPGLWMAALMVPFGANIGLLAVHASRRGLSNPGLVFTAMALGLIAVLLTAGRASDRVGRASMTIAGMAAAALGMWATAAFSGWALVLAGALSGIGFGLAQPALLASAVDLVPVDQRGSALATTGIFLEIGIGLGAIGGGVVGRALGLGVMFGLAGIPAALGAVLAWVAGHRGGRPGGRGAAHDLAAHREGP